MSNLEYITADLVSPIADVKLDIQNIPFKENEFDVVFANHVLEHIPDEHKAITEVFRILKNGGWAIMQVPLDINKSTTYEDNTIVTASEREKHFGQYDHLRLHGLDFAERLEKGGFNVETIDLVTEIGLEKSDYFRLDTTEKIYLCKKQTNIQI
jgi:predicted SAM-dependent methyltransferase